MIEYILNEMGLKSASFSPILFDNIDQSAATVWKVNSNNDSYILKRGKGNELINYQTYLSSNCVYHPKLYKTFRIDDEVYLLLEYIDGTDLMRCTRDNLIVVLDSLIALQNKFWGADLPFENLAGRINRRQYLRNPILEKTYDIYLDDCKSIPATLCHDDLLPFNVIVSGNRGVLIDWEVGGILPYTASIARLIAHTEDREGAMFFMSECDRTFALEYYYENLVKSNGIPYDSYRRSIDLALFYEYCEWVYVGNKYGISDHLRYNNYLKKAISQARILQQNPI